MGECFRKAGLALYTYKQISNVVLSRKTLKKNARNTHKLRTDRA